jgi:8-amino-7-oxononanoate synthase
MSEYPPQQPTPYPTPPLDATLAHWQAQTQARRAQALYRQTRVIQRSDSHQQAGHIFCSNDYLGLMQHPDLAAALAEGARRYGTGSGGSHLISGHSAAHQALDDALAAWFAPIISQAAALSFSTGYMANLALLTGLADKDTTLFCDKLNHASLIDGALLARAQKQCQVQRYPHANTAALERQLQASSSPHKLIVTDGVFSMDGDIVDLPRLLQLAEQYQAWVLVDDAHGLGTLGEHGQGTAAHFGVQRSPRLVQVVTFGKAAGCAGAAIIAPQPVVEWLTQSARPYIYTTASSPAMAHALQTAIALLQGTEGQMRREQLQLMISVFKSGMQAALAQLGLPWQLMPSASAIQPLVVGENATALALAAALGDAGFQVSAIRPPTVPAGTARLRLTLSAAHSQEDISALLAAFTQAAQRIKA